MVTNSRKVRDVSVLIGMRLMLIFKELTSPIKCFVYVVAPSSMFSVGLILEIQLKDAVHVFPILYETNG